MLPETGAADALSQLASAEASARVLERDVVAVDLRLPGRMTVRLAHPPAAIKTKPQQGA
jgi:cell division protein FtsQ